MGAGDGPSAEDERRLAEYASALADAVESALPAWVLRCVSTRCAEAAMVLDDTLVGSAVVAGRACAAQYGPSVRALLALDIDEQRISPLGLLRGAVRHPTSLLEQRGVPHVSRDDFAVRSFPDDPYDLTPGSFAHISPDLHEPGIAWGAAKAHVHLARRRAEGLR